MELKKFQIQFERSIGDFSEVFNYLNVLEELGMYVDFKINYKSSSFWVNVNLYNSLSAPTENPAFSNVRRMPFRMYPASTLS